MQSKWHSSAVGLPRKGPFTFKMCSKPRKVKKRKQCESIVLISFYVECGIACCLDFRNRIEFESLSFSLHLYTYGSSSRYFVPPCQAKANQPSLFIPGTLHCYSQFTFWFLMVVDFHLKNILLWMVGCLVVPFSCQPFFNASTLTHFNMLQCRFSGK